MRARDSRLERVYALADVLMRLAQNVFAA
jgi:hypothetical protein